MSILFLCLLCLTIVAVCIRPLGAYMARVYNGEPVFLEGALGWLERLIYAACGIDGKTEMTWRGYAMAVLSIGFVSFLLLFAIFMLQGLLPMNPQAYGAVTPDLAFNAALSFVTNSDWQNYSGEAALSYGSQMTGAAVQNFLSAATGMAVAAAFFRGLARRQSQTIGNAYADIVRGTLYILLPLSFLMAVFLASQGVVQTLKPYAAYQSLEDSQDTEKSSDPENRTANPGSWIALGPVASQAAIKMIGSNGGGFFNANSAHPFENPTPFSNMLQMVSILLLPAAFTYTFGAMVGDRRQGWVLLITMAAIFLPMVAVTAFNEQHLNPRFDPEIIDGSAGNMEGKEVRFGVAGSAFWAAATTATSNGSVNAMHDSFLPLGGMIPMLLMQFGEVVFGGVGSGAYGMLVFILLTVFIGGLMVGRTPEYLGKKLGPFEIKMASLVILIPSSVVLMGTAIAVMSAAGRAGISNPGAQGFSEILYAFSSAANNNGSAFAGLNGDTTFYNLALGIAMFIGRYWLMIPVLAIAGSLAAKNAVPPSVGTLPTHTPLFATMLIGIIILFGVLTYVPALALGPIVEHLHLFAH